MKIIDVVFLLALTLLSSSCKESLVSATERARAEAKIRDAAESVAYAEHSLGNEKAPGKIALKSEALRDAKARLAGLIEANSKVLTDAQQVAETHLSHVKAKLADFELDKQQDEHAAEKDESEAYDRIRKMNAQLSEEQATRQKR